MPRMIDLAKTRYDIVPGATGITNVNSPKLTELSTGTNISALVVQSTQIMPAASDTVKERSVLDVANVETPTVGNYSGKLTMFRSGSNSTGVFDTADPMLIMGAMGLFIWIVKRTGLPAAAAYAVGQTVEVYGFLTDNPILSGGNQDGFLKLEQNLHPQGQFNVAAITVA